jgi:hypothetical protein
LIGKSQWKDPAVEADVHKYHHKPATAAKNTKKAVVAGAEPEQAGAEAVEAEAGAAAVRSSSYVKPAAIYISLSQSVKSPTAHRCMEDAEVGEEADERGGGEGGARERQEEVMATERADEQHEDADKVDKYEEQQEEEKQLQLAQQHPQQQQLLCKFCGGAHKYCVLHSLQATCTLSSHSASKLSSTQQGLRSRELQGPQQELPLRLVKSPRTPPRGRPCDGEEEEEEEEEEQVRAQKCDSLSLACALACSSDERERGAFHSGSFACIRIYEVRLTLQLTFVCVCVQGAQATTKAAQQPHVPASVLYDRHAAAAAPTTPPTPLPRAPPATCLQPARFSISFSYLCMRP